MVIQQRGSQILLILTSQDEEVREVLQLVNRDASSK